MKNQRLLLALAWIATVAIAYFAGSSGGTSNPPVASSSQSASNAGGSGTDAARGAREVVRKIEPSEEELADGGKKDIALMIARARVEMGTGMGGMMNMRGMIRAISPLIELNDAQVQEALAEVEKTVKDPQGRMMFYSILLSQWAERDGRAALAYAEKNVEKGSMFGMGIKGPILGAWARTDPDAAWRWFETEGKKGDDSGQGNMLVHTLFAGLASRDIDGALARVEGLDASMKPMALNGIAMSGMNADSRKRMLERSASLPQETRDMLRQGALGQWAMMEPEAAISWLKTLPADEQKPLRSGLANSVLMMNPKQGADLLLKDASAEERPVIYDQVVSRIAWQNPKSAGEWLLEQPQGPELDSARMTFASIVARKEPATAMDWAKSVTKPELRESSISSVYAAWKQKDAAAADAAVVNVGLSAEALERVRNAPSSEFRPSDTIFAAPVIERAEKQNR